MKSFHRLCMKDNLIFGHLLNFFLLQNFKVMKVNMNMDFYRLQMHQFLVWIQTMQLKIL